MKRSLLRITILLIAVMAISSVVLMLHKSTCADEGDVAVLTVVKQEEDQQDRWVTFRLQAPKKRSMLTYGSTTFLVESAPIVWQMRGKERADPRWKDVLDPVDPTVVLKLPAEGATLFTVAGPRFVSGDTLQLRLQVLVEDPSPLGRLTDRVRQSWRFRMPVLLRGPIYSQRGFVTCAPLPAVACEPAAARGTDAMLASDVD